MDAALENQLSVKKEIMCVHRWVGHAAKGNRVARQP